jgi:phospholipid/cholesterol/gamma-HCH transport system substrate-binding protein
MAEKTPYLKLGIFVVAGLLLFIFGIFLIGKRKNPFADTFVVEALFDNAGGLRKGAPVRVTGIEKGVVDQLVIPSEPGGKVRVIMKLDGDTQTLISRESIAHVRSQGFLGEKFVEIEIRDLSPDSSSQTSIPDQTSAGKDRIVIQGVEEEDLDKLVTKANQTLDSLHGAIGEYREIATKINSGEGAVGQLLNDKELYRNVRSSVESIQSSSKRLEEIANHVRRGKGTLGDLVYGKELTPQISATLEDARRSAQRLSSLMNDIQSGKGSLGMLIHDEQAATDLRETLKSGRRAAANLEKLLAGFEKGDGPLGALFGGDSASKANFGNTIREAHTAVVQMNEVLTAAKSNFLLRGYFQDRGYFNATDIATNQFDEPVNGRIVQEYTFTAGELFGKDYSARLKRQDPLYAVGVYLMNQNYSLAAVRVYLSEVGGEAENLQLSQARAYVIREYLAKNFPLDEKKVKIKGYGENNDLPIPKERGAGIIRITVYDEKDDSLPPATN